MRKKQGKAYVALAQEGGKEGLKPLEIWGGTRELCGK